MKKTFYIISLIFAMKMISCLLIFCLILTACTNDSDIVITEVTQSEITETVTPTTPATSISTTISTTAETSPENWAFVWNVEHLSSSEYDYFYKNLFQLDYISRAFMEFATTDEVSAWSALFPDEAKFLPDITKKHNLYTFLINIDISKEQIIEIIKSTDEYREFDSKHYYDMTEEQLNALISLDPEKIAIAFKPPQCVAKGVNVYTPGWFCYAKIEDYKESDLTIEELTFLFDRVRYGEYKDMMIPEKIEELEDRLNGFAK